MSVTIISHGAGTTINAFDSSDGPTVTELGVEHEKEALDFLAARPIHTVFMASLIQDNGLVSRHNRGSFYACRDQLGRLDGVALVGHATVVEAHSESSVAAFARLARNCDNTHLIRGERETIECFWKYYASTGRKPRVICRELLFHQNEPRSISEVVGDLRPANLDELEQVMKVNAGMAVQEAGINPLNHDASGFRQRTVRRIEQGRVWVLVQDGRLVFKADVLAETPEANYVEGVHVHPEERMKGHGLRCLTQLSSVLLERTESICLTVNEDNKKAVAFYAKAGYQFSSLYETIYLR
jgi:uncharacterized protein